MARNFEPSMVGPDSDIRRRIQFLADRLIQTDQIKSRNWNCDSRGRFYPDFISQKRRILIQDYSLDDSGDESSWTPITTLPLRFDNSPVYGPVQAPLWLPSPRPTHQHIRVQRHLQTEMWVLELLQNPDVTVEFTDTSDVETEPEGYDTE